MLPYFHITTLVAFGDLQTLIPCYKVDNIVKRLAPLKDRLKLYLGQILTQGHRVS